MTEAGISPAQARAAAVDDAVRREVVLTLFQTRPLALGVGAIFTLVLAGMFHGRVSTLSLSAWVVGMALATVHGAHGWWQFRAAVRSPDWDARHFLRVYTRQIWLVGALFGLAGWLFYHPTFGEARWLVVLLLLSFNTGLVALYTLHLPIYQAWLALLSLPLALRFAVSGAPGGWVGMALLVLHAVGILLYARRLARFVQEAMRARHENALLVAELQVAAQQLAEANEAKSRFFAAASHDLRQPVQAIGYYTELLAGQGAAAPTLERIRQCVTSLDGLLEGVLTLARLDAGKVHRHLFATDLSALAGRMRQLHEGAAMARGLRLRLRTPAVAWAMTDAVLLERVLGNLLANALRYTRQGGVLLAVRRRSTGWRIQVIDSGIGIAPQSQAAVFDEFVQLDNPQRDVNQGVGLGLATVRRLCTLLEHPLALRSRPGHGSSFSIDVPACDAPPAVASPAVVADAPAPLSGSVLIVEDNPEVRESLARMLAQWGLRCEACSDGAQALAAWRPGRFDVVLSDWRLPGHLNGAQLIAALRAQPGAHGTRFALVTGETEDSLGPLPIDVQVLRKPVRPIRLRALLSSAPAGSPD